MVHHSAQAQACPLPPAGPLLVLVAGGGAGQLGAGTGAVAPAPNSWAGSLSSVQSCPALCLPSLCSFQPMFAPSRGALAGGAGCIDVLGQPELVTSCLVPCCQGLSGSLASLAGVPPAHRPSVPAYAPSDPACLPPPCQPRQVLHPPAPGRRTPGQAHAPQVHGQHPQLHLLCMTSCALALVPPPLSPHSLVLSTAGATLQPRVCRAPL